AFILTLMLTPALGKLIPPLPTSAITLFLLIISEILIGIFIASICKVLISVTHIVGTILSLQSGISSAVVFDVTQRTQGSLIGNLLGIVAVTLLFATGLHHLMLRGIAESYTAFAPGKLPPLKDFVEIYSHLVSQIFIISVQISAPLVIIGTLLFLAGGVIGRLMPSMQVFSVITAPQLMIGFFIIITTFSAMMLWYMDFYKDTLTDFFKF
ncbi:MAG: flagellar biosynthetic protein FliR, partial [Pseudomonadota bacterium]